MFGIPTSRYSIYIFFYFNKCPCWLVILLGWMQAHLDAQHYRNKPLMNFNDLCLIFAYTTADGRYSRSSHDIDFDDEMQGMYTGLVLFHHPCKIEISIVIDMHNAFYWLSVIGFQSLIFHRSCLPKFIKNPCEIQSC